MAVERNHSYWFMLFIRKVSLDSQRRASKERSLDSVEVCVVKSLADLIMVLRPSHHLGFFLVQKSQYMEL